MPAKRVIALDRPNAQEFRFALWADVPVARQSFYAKPAGFKSAWKDASAADNLAFETGAVVERVETYQYEGTKTIAQVQADLQARWTSFQAEVAAANPWNFYGSYWTGAAWVVGGAT